MNAADQKQKSWFDMDIRQITGSGLESDIRKFHLAADINIVRETPYGVRYEVKAALLSPSGRQLPVKTVWQIDKGTDFPRLITLVPD